MASKKKYTTVKPRSLPDTWVDRDVLLAHMVFELLTQFIEDEEPGQIMDWSADAEHKAAWKEMNDLYKWWNKVYLPYEDDQTWLEGIESGKLVRKKCSSIRNATKVKFVYSSPEAERKARAALRARNKLEQRMYTELTERCKRVISIRQFLWS